MVRGDTGKLTYRELRERSAAFGGLLSELGVKPGDNAWSVTMILAWASLTR
jgi:acyl-coenzyme A synthetase/AMP-(fatty) acid ligase